MQLIKGYVFKRISIHTISPTIYKLYLLRFNYIYKCPFFKNIVPYLPLTTSFVCNSLLSMNYMTLKKIECPINLVLSRIDYRGENFLIKDFFCLYDSNMRLYVR